MAAIVLLGCACIGSKNQIRDSKEVTVDSSQAVVKEISPEVEAKLIARLKAEFRAELEAVIQPVVAAVATVQNYTSGIKTKMDNVREANTAGRDAIIKNNSTLFLIVCAILVFLGFKGDELLKIILAWSGRKTVEVAKKAIGRASDAKGGA